jgi:hypothetical protein
VPYSQLYIISLNPLNGNCGENASLIKEITLSNKIKEHETNIFVEGVEFVTITLHYHLLDRWYEEEKLLVATKKSVLPMAWVVRELCQQD